MTYYIPISIREAIENVNTSWFIPAIQRPYDWGQRYKKKVFIRKLFDSILRRYPIGTLIIWKTEEEIPFREFLREFNSKKLKRIKDRGQWGGKELVYDGQQRLQSLYSCLLYDFEGEILTYNMLFDKSKDGSADGFKFFLKNQEIGPEYIRLNKLFECKKTSSQIRFEDESIKKLEEKRGELSDSENEIIKGNFKELWNVFVEKDIKLLAVYPLEKIGFNKQEVQEIFTRINTTGMTLSKSEILFSKIKDLRYDFEEKIWDRSLKIEEQTAGFSVSPDDILQIIHLVKTGMMRVDPERLEVSELKDFVKIWNDLKYPLSSFFCDFLFTTFKINHDKIIRVNNALVPMILYFYYMYKRHNKKYKDFSPKSQRNLKKFLILCQLNDWSLQSFIDGSQEILEYRIEKNGETEFPFMRFRNLIKDSRKRKIELDSNDLYNHIWFSLKILTPKRQYHVVDDPDFRYNPEIDHIFPRKPNTEEQYAKKRYDHWVDTIWDLQPVTGDINGKKRAIPPKEFFSEHMDILRNHYDHIPTIDINNDLWLIEKADKFIGKRKKKMLKFLETEYGLNVKEVRDKQ